MVTTLVIVPADGEPMLVLGYPKLGLFKMLKNSERNVSPNFSVKRKSLCAPKSHVTSPGAMMMLRPAFPNV